MELIVNWDAPEPPKFALWWITVNPSPRTVNSAAPAPLPVDADRALKSVGSETARASTFTTLPVYVDDVAEKTDTFPDELVLINTAPLSGTKSPPF